MLGISDGLSKNDVSTEPCWFRGGSGRSARIRECKAWPEHLVAGSRAVCRGERLFPVWAVWTRRAFAVESLSVPCVYISVLCTPPANVAHWRCGFNASLRALLPSSLDDLSPFCSSGAIFLFTVLWLSCCLPVSVSFLSVSHALHLQKVIFPRQDDVLISFLPLAHMFERVIQVRNCLNWRGLVGLLVLSSRVSGLLLVRMYTFPICL